MDYKLKTKTSAEAMNASMAHLLEVSAHSIAPGTCPLISQLSALSLMRAQSCGKCVACKEGLDKLYKHLKGLIKGYGTHETLEEMRELAEYVSDASDCAIGYQTAKMFLEGLEVFALDYEHHIEHGCCAPEVAQQIPCVEMCPAKVNVPAYIESALNSDFENALKIIRADNPFVSVCAYVCEHPCEKKCRRQLLDSPLNIRGIKKFIVDKKPAIDVAEKPATSLSGKNVAVIGGGPAGLSCAYFLSKMGHNVQIFEAKPELGGMLRYGIPDYRLPKYILDEDIQHILDLGNIHVECDCDIASEENLENILENFDATFVSVGAQIGNKLQIPGAEEVGAISAIDFLHNLANGELITFMNKDIVVVGGGNVAMDAARTALRLGANSVKIVYRRRLDDMTATEEEVMAAREEGIEILTLLAPKELKEATDGRKVFVAQPQMVGQYDMGGRPAVRDKKCEPVDIECDEILVAIGQSIDSGVFEASELPTNRSRLVADEHCLVSKGVYAGGDCVTGPKTAIAAVASGKIAALNIDKYLGYNHSIDIDFEIPDPHMNVRLPFGRMQVPTRPVSERIHDFDGVEIPWTEDEARQECMRCLRCDFYGCDSDKRQSIGMPAALYEKIVEGKAGESND